MSEHEFAADNRPGKSLPCQIILGAALEALTQVKAGWASHRIVNPYSQLHASEENEN